MQKLKEVLLCVVAAYSLAACSGGGGDDNGGGNNRAPTANAGNDQTVVESSAVQLSGSGSDPDAGDAISFSWSQISGTSVTISSPTSANAGFTAPDVTAGNPEMLGFRLTVTDAAGLSASDDVTVTVQEPGAVVTISGNMMYEFPPPLPMCNGLNFLNVQERPIRRATVQALDETGTTVLDSDITDDLGAYSLTVAASTNIIIRVRAELKQGGNPSWDVEVRNNVDTSGSPPPLNQRPIYVMDSSVMDSGVIDSTHDMTAATGWDTVSASFTGVRSASPFSILDAIYSAMELVMVTDPAASFTPLDAFWSPDNTSTNGAGTFDENIASGEIGTSFYSGDRLFLLGKDGDDAEEFDDHVIVHEWGHYFEDNFSRSDSIGGAHSVGDILDMRVAFGEGWATALSGIALDNPTYCDTLWFGATMSGFEIDIESEGGGTAGWFNEISVMKIIYDLWDTNDDGADNASIGFAPIYDVMAGPQAITEAFTSIFTFATELKAVSGQDAFINALLAEQNIETNIDLFGSTETNDAGAAVPGDVFPIYTDITLGVPENICVNSQFDGGRDGNKLSEHRFLRLNLPASQPVTFTMTRVSPAPTTPTPGFDCTTAPDDDPEIHEHSDPDFTVWQNGALWAVGFSCEPNTEVEPTLGAIPAGDYVIDIFDFRHEDEESLVGYPEQVCFDFTAN